MPDPMCCLLGVCCPQDPENQGFAAVNEKRVRALAELVRDAGGNTPEDIARHLLANVGIVPLGMDVAMAEGYRPFFKEMRDTS